MDQANNTKVNSLVAVEIKSWFSKEFHAELTVTEIGQSAISALALQVVKTSKLLTGRFKEQGEISKTDVAQVAEAPDVADTAVYSPVSTKLSPVVRECPKRGPKAVFRSRS